MTAMIHPFTPPSPPVLPVDPGADADPVFALSPAPLSPAPPAPTRPPGHAPTGPLQPVGAIRDVPMFVIGVQPCALPSWGP